jgi:hypothetical protein
MKGICALSGEDAILQSSHIYPKFAVKYIRSTSNNSLLRSYGNVNIPRQDGMKMHLLSRESEQRFSSAETWFAGNIFHPVTQSGITNFPYDNHLYYFIVSLLWRALQVEIRSGKYTSEPYYPQMVTCEKQWRSFLKDGYVPQQYKDIFMMVTHPNQLTIPGLAFTQYYLMRNLDLTIVTDDRGSVYVYAKLPRFLFWAPLITRHFSHVNLIDPQGSHFDTFEPPEDPFMLGFIPNRIRQINEMQPELSPQQEAATLARIRRDPEGFLSSEAGQL